MENIDNRPDIPNEYQQAQETVVSPVVHHVFLPRWQSSARAAARTGRALAPHAISPVADGADWPTDKSVPAGQSSKLVAGFLLVMRRPSG